MTWKELVDKLNGEQYISLRPVQRGWFNQQYLARVSIEARRNCRNKLFTTLHCITDPTYSHLNITRTRQEGDSYRIYCNSAQQVQDILDWIKEYVDDEFYYFDGVDCPFNDFHSETLDSDFPTIVRKALYEKEYRYRVVAQIPYRTDAERLYCMLQDWKEWQETKQGKMGRGAKSKLSVGKNAKWFSWGGTLSFYTNDQEISFLMKLTYPEYYDKTEKVVLLTETA